MMIHTEILSIVSEGDFYSRNITPQIQAVVEASGIQEGQALVFYRHTTGALLMVEHEIGIVVDLEKILEELTPTDGDYTHHRRGYDKNGAAHLRTALMNVSVTVPILEGLLMLGTYQEILMLDMDSGVRSRQIVVQITGV
jgi:secondary thiamine-phosphate synthase enzyme